MNFKSKSQLSKLTQKERGVMVFGINVRTDGNISLHLVQDKTITTSRNPLRRNTNEFKRVTAMFRLPEDQAQEFANMDPGSHFLQVSDMYPAIRHFEDIDGISDIVIEETQTLLGNDNPANIMKNRNGQDITINIEGTLYPVYRFTELRPLDDTHVDITQADIRAARFHKSEIRMHTREYQELNGIGDLTVEKALELINATEEVGEEVEM